MSTYGEKMRKSRSYTAQQRRDGKVRLAFRKKDKKQIKVFIRGE